MTDLLTISDVQGMEALRQRLTDPVLFRAAMNEVMAQARRQGLAAAKGKLEGTGQGFAVRTLFGEYSPMQARIWTLMSRHNAESIEVGRKPGNAPSYKAITFNKYRIRSDRRIARELSREQWREVRKTWWAIESLGFDGKHYMQAARQRIIDRLPVWLQRAGDRIIKRLAGKAT